MARFDMSGLDDIVRQMRALESGAEDVERAMIEAGAREVAQAWKRSAEEHGLKDTGEMIESIGPGKIHTGGLAYCDIYPQGTDHKGVRNAEKAFRLHYGWSSFKATRWVDDADKYSEATAVPAMAAVFEEFISTGRIGGTGADGITTTKG